MMNVESLAVEGRLAPLSFTLNKGEKLHVIGPNGSGKSTLLHGLAGILPATGTVELNKQLLFSASIERQAYLRAYLAQNERPSFHIAVYQYLQLSRLDPHNQDFDSVVDYLCRCLSLTHKLSHSIFHLSGGEWQRVRLAGICLQIWPSLNPDAQLLILDEPAAALDIGQERLLYQLIDEVAGFGICVIMANHDLNRTLHYADKVLLLNQGQLVAQGRTEQVMNETLIGEVFETEVKMRMVDDKKHLFFD